MPALFIQERQRRRGIHYHVIFLLFGSQPLPPEAMRAKLSTEIFDRWHAINGGTVLRQANWLTLRQKDLIGLSYLLKGVDPTGKKLARATHWWGVRLSGVLKANSLPVPKKEVSAAFRFVFNRQTVAIRTPKPIERVKFTKDSIDYFKAYLRETGAAHDWKSYKRSICGKNVSDDEFLVRMNSRA